MDHSPRNLSPDTEWMLLSGQVSAEVLARALIEEYAQDLYALWYLLTGDLVQAWDGLGITLGQALLRASQYSGVSSGRAWLYQQALAVWRSSPKFGKRPLSHFPWQDLEAGRPNDDPLETQIKSTLSECTDRDSFIILLSLWQTCSAAEIAHIVDLETVQVEQVLKQFKTSIFEKFPEGGYTSAEKMLNRWFTTRVEQWRGIHPINDPKAESLLARVLASGRVKLTRQRLFTRLAESFLVGLVILGIWGLFRAMDQLFPEPQPTQDIVYATVLVTRTPSGGPLGPGMSAGGPVRSILEPQAGKEIFYYTVQAGDDLQAIAEKIGGREVVEIIRFNRLAPGQVLKAGQKLIIPPLPEPSPYPSATPVPGSGFGSWAWVESPPRSPGAPRLFSQYRWNTEGWDTVWVDLVYRDHRQYPQHPTAGRVRVQAWLSDNQILAIQGIPEGSPQQVLLAWLDAGKYYQAAPDELEGRYRPIEPEQFTTAPLIRSYLTRLFNPFFPGLRRGERSFRLVGVETINGVEVEVLEGRNREGWLINRLWIDREGGLILRSQRFSGDQAEQLEDEIRVTRWSYNIDFPQELFDPRFPWRGGFAQDYRGNPEITTVIKPVVPVLAAGSTEVSLPAPNLPTDELMQPLSLRVNGSSSGSLRTYQPVDIFAGETYLGQIRLNNLDKLVCERSPDGKIIAFINDPGSRHKPLTYLHWFSLANQTAPAQQSLAGIKVEYFAFAPDSRRLAFFGQDGWRQGLFVYDLIDNRLDFLLKLDAARSIAWRPDGKYILLIGNRQGETMGGEKVILVRASDGQEFYTQPDELVSGDLFNWPELQWGVNFPVEMGDLASCTS